MFSERLTTIFDIHLMCHHKVLCFIISYFLTECLVFEYNFIFSLTSNKV